MRNNISASVFIFYAAIASQGVSAADETPTLIKAAVVHDGHLLCLHGDGTIAAWDTKKGKYAPEVAKKFNRKGILNLGSGGGCLWAAEDSCLYKWAAKSEEWEKKGTFDSDKESLIAIVSVGESPLLVFPSKVIDPLGKRTIKAPKIDRPKGGPPHRILATHGTDTMLWIGTGNGEWGGELLGLDLKTEKWVTGNGNGYVTGITHSEKDEVTVSWSMSHFGAYTQVQIHKSDATVKKEHPKNEDQYYQKLAFSTYDKTLYGIETERLVTIKDGKATEVVKLTGKILEREPNAIGVAPSVLDIIPVGAKSVIVVPKSGEPWLVRDGLTTVFKTP